MEKVTTLATPAAVKQSYNAAHASSPADSFWAGLLVTPVISEIVGPLVGYPTISGMIYRDSGLASDDVTMLRMLLVITVQLGLTAAAAVMIGRTAWPLWLAIRLKKNRAIVLPEAHARQTVMGLMLGLFAVIFMTVQVYESLDKQSPYTTTHALMAWEVLIFALVSGYAAATVLLAPKVHYRIQHPDQQIFERMEQAPVRVEVSFDHTAFDKSILLIRSAQDYVLANIQSMIELHGAEYALINVGVFEQAIHERVEITSANTFGVRGRLSVSVHLPSEHDSHALNVRGVDNVVRNLYMKFDLFSFLKNRLSLALNGYTGAVESGAKSLVDDFNLKMAKYEAMSAGLNAEAYGQMSAMNGTALGQQQVGLMRARTEMMLQEIQRFRDKWAKARNLHEQGRSEFPKFFNKQLTAHMISELEGATDDREAAETVERLMHWVRVDFHVEAFEFIGPAANAERLFDDACEKAIENLRKAEAGLSDDARAREGEIRAVLDNLLAKFDPKDLIGTRRRIFQELMTIRMQKTLPWNQEDIMQRIHQFDSLGSSGSPALLPRQKPDILSPPVRIEGSIEELQVLQALQGPLRALPPGQLKTAEARRQIDNFVRCYKDSSEQDLLNAAYGLVMQLSQIEYVSDEPT